jgi:hypothetical protein
MKSKTIDHINIWLLIISFVIAIYLPFELFLFSYAFLGPLHYLTEINWLDDKKFFLKSKAQIYRVFIAFAVIISAFPLLKYLDSIESFKYWMDWLGPNKNSILLLSGFMFSVSLIFLKKSKHILLAFLLSIMLSVVCTLYIPLVAIVIGVFLPTLVHVYIFTLLFMIFGQLKAKSRPGLISVLLLTLVPLVIIFLDIKSSTYVVSNYTKTSYSGSGFVSLNTSVADLLGVDKKDFFLLSSVGIKIQIFIAFAYTYHYLNWFSKTAIIGWKSSLTNKRAKYIIVLWLSSVGLYLYDYKTGIIALFFLSLLHVVLEFPLNVTTIKELVIVVFKWLRLRFKKV